MQAAGRRMAYYGLHHVLGLGVAYHSASSTGRLVRMIERGTWAVLAATHAQVLVRCRKISFQERIGARRLFPT